MTDETKKGANAHAIKLAHDVGKYISRAALNIKDESVPKEVVKLLVEDLYAIDGSERASRVFEELAKPLEQQIADERLAKCRAHLRIIDGLEQEIRSFENNAIHKAAKSAVTIRDLLLALAKDLNEA